MRDLRSNHSIGSPVAVSDALAETAETAKTAADLGRASKSANTLRVYEADWRAFQGWWLCRKLAALPAEPTTVGLYIAAAGTGVGALAPSSIERALAGISAQHRLNGFAFDRRHPAIADVLSCLKRKVKRPVEPLQPIPRKVLRASWREEGCAWMWRHWGTSLPLRQTSCRFEHRRQRHKAGIEVVAVFDFLSADWSPWRALAAWRRKWKQLRFKLTTIYDDAEARPSVHLDHAA